jgi:2-hydroxy-4-carboxymuconate semialdehyde hemiacetal dehydrogenase
MAFRVAIIGYGAVASVHALQSARQSDIALASVWGPDRDKAGSFASKFGVAHIGASLVDAIERADAAIVASPSALHFEQARECLQHGVPTLVELPPCANHSECRALGQFAEQRQTLVRCAHTSRYLAPYVLIRDALRTGKIGPVQQIEYVRHHRRRERSWTDSALLHHAAHPVDLLIEWFRTPSPLACAAVPDVEHAQSVSLLAELPNRAPATISITYASHLLHSRVLIVGERHTIETDGFSYLRSDCEELSFCGGEQSTYEDAIRVQDMEFVRACHGGKAGTDWEETVKLVETMDRFRLLARRAEPAAR